MSFQKSLPDIVASLGSPQPIQEELESLDFLPLESARYIKLWGFIFTKVPKNMYLVKNLISSNPSRFLKSYDQPQTWDLLVIVNLHHAPFHVLALYHIRNWMISRHSDPWSAIWEVGMIFFYVFPTFPTRLNLNWRFIIQNDSSILGWKKYGKIKRSTFRIVSSKSMKAPLE